MGNCVVELFGLDMGAAYEHAFVYIRELAVAAAGRAQRNRTKDAFREVYCWQTVNTLELWAKLLAAHHDKEASSRAPGTLFSLVGIGLYSEWRSLFMKGSALRLVPVEWLGRVCLAVPADATRT